MVYEDDEEMQEGPVVVRRAVYDAGTKLQGGVKAGDMLAFETARSEAVNLGGAVVGESIVAAALTRAHERIK